MLKSIKKCNQMSTKAVTTVKKSFKEKDWTNSMMNVPSK